MPKLPAPTANIDVKASKLSCGLGILKTNKIAVLRNPCGIKM
jgi:hypothetical protein